MQSTIPVLTALLDGTEASRLFLESDYLLARDHISKVYQLSAFCLYYDMNPTLPTISRIKIDSQSEYHIFYTSMPLGTILFIQPPESAEIKSAADAKSVVPSTATATATPRSPSPVRVATASHTSGGSSSGSGGGKPRSPPRDRLPALLKLTINTGFGGVSKGPKTPKSPLIKYTPQEQMAAVVKERDGYACVVTPSTDPTAKQAPEAIHILSASETLRTLPAGTFLTAAGAEWIGLGAKQKLASPIPYGDAKHQTVQEWAYVLRSEATVPLPVDGGSYDPRLALYADARLNRLLNADTAGCQRASSDFLQN